LYWLYWCFNFFLLYGLIKILFCQNLSMYVILEE
jgi:hypothetical protein